MGCCLSSERFQSAAAERPHPFAHREVTDPLPTGLNCSRNLSHCPRLKISIIFPAFNEERLLGDTLEHTHRACAAFHRRGWSSEIIVCDNNSTDCTSDIARAAGARVVFEPVNQISRARNRGASVATGEWLVFVDADSHPSLGLFEDVAVQIEQGRCLAGGAEVQINTQRFIARFLNAVWNLISRWGRWMAGSFIFVETTAFRHLGGFSETLFVGEELELTERLKKLATEQGRTLIILRQHPLTTSGRKVELYSLREMAWFFLKALVARQQVLQSREACHPWYDGRR